MRKFLIGTAALFIVPVLQAATSLNHGGVVLISDAFSGCIIVTPSPPTYSLSVISGDSAASRATTVPLSKQARLGVVAWSDRAGMIVTSEHAGGSFLSVLNDDGSMPALGIGTPVPGGTIRGIAPASTDILVLATIPLPNDGMQGELWRLAPSGELLARMSLPTPDVSSLDVAADQCTVFYTAPQAIARYDACA